MNDIVGSSLDQSFQLLHEAETKLKGIVNNRFDASVHSNDVASVERFFKIFPLLGLHEEGLTKFGKYLSSQVRLQRYCKGSFWENTFQNTISCLLTL